MDTILKNMMTSTFLFSAIRVTTPILYPALGALITNKAGVPNIGLEGTMLVSALAGVVGSAYSGSAFIGLLCAILMGVAMSLLLAYFTLKLKTDVILGGIALNLFASGATVFVLYYLTGDKGTSAALASKVLPDLNIPVIKEIPFIGDVISGHNILTYIAFISIFVMSYLLKKTALGLRVKAVGENENAAASVGIHVDQTRFIAFVISGVLCGLGGAFLSMGYVSWFSRDMTASRGWIALAAEAMGRSTVSGTVFSTFLFGTASAMSNSLQLINIPAELVSIVPYVFTVVCLVGYAFIAHRQKIRKRIKMTKNWEGG